MEQIIKDKQSSVEVNRTSTGKYSWSVKIYFNEEETENEKVLEKVKSIEEKLKERYGNE
jgi:hypothetical protein